MNDRSTLTKLKLREDHSDVIELCKFADCDFLTVTGVNVIVTEIF